MEERVYQVVICFSLFILLLNVVFHKPTKQQTQDYYGPLTLLESFDQDFETQYANTSSTIQIRVPMAGLTRASIAELVRHVKQQHGNVMFSGYDCDYSHELWNCQALTITYVRGADGDVSGL